MLLHAVLTGLALGALSIPHCAAMCGPLATLACSRHQGGRAALRYQAGRSLGYGIAGALAGHFGEALQLLAPGATTWLLFSSLAAVACLALAYRLSRAPRTTELVQLGVRRTRRSLFAVLAPLLPHEPAAFGLMSALLPCGALGAALLSAAATANATLGAAVMLGFVTASSAFLFGAGLLARWLPARGSQALRRSAAAALVMVAVVLVARPIAALATSAPGESARAVHCH